MTENEINREEAEVYSSLEEVTGIIACNLNKIWMWCHGVAAGLVTHDGSEAVVGYSKYHRKFALCVEGELELRLIGDPDPSPRGGVDGSEHFLVDGHEVIDVKLTTDSQAVVETTVGTLVVSYDGEWSIKEGEIS